MPRSTLIHIKNKIVVDRFVVASFFVAIHLQVRMLVVGMEYQMNLRQDTLDKGNCMETYSALACRRACQISSERARCWVTLSRSHFCCNVYVCLLIKYALRSVLLVRSVGAAIMTSFWIW